MKWPLVMLTRQQYERLRLENLTLPDALRESNAELARYRSLISGLRTGRDDMTKAVEAAFEKERG